MVRCASCIVTAVAAVQACCDVVVELLVVLYTAAALLCGLGL